MYQSEVFDNLHRETLATLYLDFQKAFDKVCHEKLIDKLHASGIRGNTLLFFESYLVGRKQKVRIGNTSSTALDIHSGVPQGSVLGLLLVIVYIYDLPDCIISKCFGFADDYKLINYNGVAMQIDASKSSRWSDDNMMTYNIVKCKVLPFEGDIKIKMSKKWKQRTSVEKDLGIMVASDLSWKHQAICKGNPVISNDQKKYISPNNVESKKGSLSMLHSPDCILR